MKIVEVEKLKYIVHMSLKLNFKLPVFSLYTNL